MPQVTELEKGAPIVHDGSDNTDSDSDDDVPELEETQATGQSQVRIVLKKYLCMTFSRDSNFVKMFRLPLLLVSQKSW